MTEEEYKAECRKINEQIKPREGFLDELKVNLSKRLEEEEKRKKEKRARTQKIAAVFLTCTLVTTGVFASAIGDWFTSMFSNIDPSIETAIENGYIQDINMDYVEHDGIGIKVNSLIIDDNKLNVIFDVKGEIDGSITLEQISVEGKDNGLYSNTFKFPSISYDKELRTIDKTNHVLIIQFSNTERKIIDFDEINVILNTIYITNENNDTNVIEGQWNCVINVDKSKFINEDITEYKYEIKENENLQNYNINVTNSCMNLKLVLKDEIIQNIKPENIEIIDEDNNKYNCAEFSKIKDNEIEMNIPITIYNKVERFKIILNSDNKQIELNVEKQES